MTTLRRYVREAWSCPKCGASNPTTVDLNRKEHAEWKHDPRMKPPPRTLFDPSIRYRDLDHMGGEDGWLEVECPRCGHVQKFATEDAADDVTKLPARVSLVRQRRRKLGAKRR